MLNVKNRKRSKLQLLKVRPEDNFSYTSFSSSFEKSPEKKEKKRMECGKFCAHFGHLITLMASLFTMILLVMVYSTSTGCDTSCASLEGQCLCPRDTKDLCEIETQCYWLVAVEGKCIHQTERLYNALFKKLNKRGKKDFAIQVFYNSRPGKVNLPNGIYGPHTIGAFSHLQVVNGFGFFDREQKIFTYA